MSREWNPRNRDRTQESRKRKMIQHGAGLKRIEAFGPTRRKVRRRGGLREEV